MQQVNTLMDAEWMNICMQIVKPDCFSISIQIRHVPN